MLAHSVQWLCLVGCALFESVLCGLLCSVAVSCSTLCSVDALCSALSVQCLSYVVYALSSGWLM